MRVFLYILIIYLVYRLVADFLLPVYRTTRQVKNEFRSMQDQMNDFMKKQQDHAGQSNGSAQNDKQKEEPPGEYIDFEEVK